MLLALLSDTHDNAQNTRAALALFARRSPAAYLHAGDLVSPEMLPLFTGLSFHFVFGNNEYDLAALRSGALAHGVHCHELLADLTFSGKRVALLHGHQPGALERLLEGGRHDYIIHGHTHVRRDERIRTGDHVSRVINPGALQRARTKSVALLDLATDRLEFLDVA
jgi:putative phosphoesterase